MNIIFIADSATMLLELDRLLKKNVNIIWVVFHESLYKELLTYGVESSRVIFFDLRFPFISKPLFLKRILNKIFHYIFKESSLDYYIQSLINRLNKEYKPKFYLTDTSKLLSKIDTKLPKATILHSVTYKNFYLDSSNLNYDILFLPGNYHKNRIKEYYSKTCFKKQQLKVVGNLKLSPFVDNRKLDNKSKRQILESYGLNPNWPLVLYAPTYDAFKGQNFFPEEFGGQYEKLNEYAEFLEKNKFNIIIKFHHYMACNFESKEIEGIIKRKNARLFKTNKNYDTIDGDSLLMASDIVVGDTSGILTTAIYLDKKIIFLEPDKFFNWSSADIEKHLRPGYVCNTFDDLLNATSCYMKKDEFIEKRNTFSDNVFFNKELNAYPLLKNLIIEHLKK